MMRSNATVLIIMVVVPSPDSNFPSITNILTSNDLENHRVLSFYENIVKRFMNGNTQLDGLDETDE